MDLHPGRIGYHPNEFTPIWSSIHARSNSPGMKYCSNWVEIHGFTPNLTGHKLLVKLGGNSLRLHHHLMKNKYKVIQYI